MIKLSILSPSLLLSTAACLALGAAQEVERRPLDVEAWARWRRLEDPRLSLGGERILYQLAAPDGGDGQLRARACAQGSPELVVERGSDGRFDAGAAWLVCLIEPTLAAKRAAELAEKKPEELPKRGLALIELASGGRRDVERVASFALPVKGGTHLAWLHERDPEAKSEGAGGPDGEASAAEPKPTGEAGTTQAEPKGEAEAVLSRAEKKKRAAKAKGAALVLLRLGSQDERRFEDVEQYAFDERGTHLAFTVSSEAGERDGLYLLDLGAEGQGDPRPLLTGKGNYGRPVFSEDGRRLACLSNQADYASDEPHWSLYAWSEGEREARLVAADGTAGLLDGWSVSQHREPWFSESGARLFLGSAPSPRPDPEPLPKAERALVDVWNWRDARIQPQQLVELEADLKRSYLAVWHFGSERLVQLGSEQIPDIRVPREGECARALGSSDLPYRRASSWELPDFEDIWVIDVESGATRQLLTGAQGHYQLSPGGNYVYGWDGRAESWVSVPAAGGRPRHISAGLPLPLADHRHDTPEIPPSYGAAGWTRADERLVVYDRHDLWSLDPEGRGQPQCLTRGLGRESGLVLRWLDLDPEEEWLDAGPWLLSALNESTRDAGFWRIDAPGAADEAGQARELLSGPWRFERPVMAEQGEWMRLTRQSFREYPDLWIARADLSGLQRLSDANPQQAEYRWGSAELVHWTSTDGEALDGILYKPDDFDPSRRYPLLVNFYERSADSLHDHDTPIPNRSSISYPYYTSRGYLIFVPDIHYQVGYPGRSAEQSVLPGIAKLIDTGFVDSARIGVQGHSWGGYQIAWLVTQTKLFAAAVAGAPVSNMTSAYGGIRWGSGLSRMFQYEKSQSRIGGTLWEAEPRYIENSPIFFADAVETPLLILHNDKDGAVPWTQGIELFLALRRLDKPSWLLNYNDEEHGLTKYANKRDYAIRMAQFFDHYLLDAPAPEWLAEGVPATEKSRTLGLALETGE